MLSLKKENAEKMAKTFKDNLILPYIFYNGEEFTAFELKNFSKAELKKVVVGNNGYFCKLKDFIFFCNKLNISLFVDKNLGLFIKE